MNLDDMRRLDALKTYKELEEAKKTINNLNLRVKHDFETILKFKAENQRLTNKIKQLYEGAEEQRHRIQRLEEAIQERDKEWFQVIESILGFHPVSMTEALRIGIERIKKQKQRIKRLEEAGDAMADVLVWSSGTQYKRSPTASAWRKAKEDKL